MKLRSILSFAALALVAVAASARSASAYPEVNSYGTDPTSDIALIYAGGDNRPQWTVDDWMPYVVHTYSDGKKDWLFDAFLLLEFRKASRDASFETSARGGHATKEDWEWLMNNHMKVLASLDSAITIAKGTLGEPRLRHKVVIGVPSAIKQQTTRFGRIENREMDFSKDEDRIAADKWAIDRTIDLFNAANFKNFDLEGLYWIEESLHTNGGIMPTVNDWIYRKGYRSYWIPYWPDNTQFAFNWQKYGFDTAYLQPNYFFDRNVPVERLEVVCDDSKRYGLGLEMEFETQGTSKVQHGDPDSYYDRLVDYLDVFERKGVFDESAVAWYSGTKGFIDLAKSKDKEDHALTDRMARTIAKRQAKKAEALQWPEYPVRDIALIYQGGSHRIDWTKKDFEPYVVHTFADGSRNWTFDGYLFLEMPHNFGKNTKKDWEWYLDRLFEKGKSLDALDACIADTKKQLGDPGFRHKIVLTLFDPAFGSKEWGELNGRQLDFNRNDDRLAAVKWFAGELTRRFKEAGYSNLDLQALYWFDEDMIPSHGLAELVRPYVEEQGLDFMWIPYFKARGNERHADIGFDITYMQPNHFFSANIPDKRLDETCDFALRRGMAVEFECDSRAMSQSEPSFLPRMQAYIDAFERWGVWDSCPVAYYLGSQALLDMKNKPTPENQAITDRLARIIIERRARPAIVSK